MKNRKRAIGVVLVVIMTLSLAVMENPQNFSWFCDVAFAESTFTSDDNVYKYTVLDDDTVKIVQHLQNNETVIIPSTLGGKSVTSIGDSAFVGSSSLKNITLPNSIKSIGNSAFKGCAKLESVTIPGNVTDIGEFAFCECTGLTSVTIQEGVENIKHDAFNGCTSLAAITIPNSVTQIGEWTFYNCTSLENIIIPSGVDSIGLCTFSGCTSLKSITIPDSVTQIGEAAFNGCTSLESITIPNSVESIANGTFYGCTSLATITISDSVTQIGDGAFQGCTGLESITIPNSVQSIGDSTFYECTSLENVIMPNSMSEIKEWAFSGCTSLTSMKIPSGVEKIQGAFYGCTSLAAVTIPDSVTEIGEQAFYNCTSLISITIPNKVTKIGDWAFSSTGLQSITIPDSVTSIGNYALPNISGLKIYGNTGTAAETYAISKNLNYELIKDISTLTAELSSNSFVYDSIAKTPEVIVKDNTTTLVKDKDYTVAYIDNTAVGTATVIITGKGKYVGEKKVTFEIKSSGGGSSSGGSGHHSGGSSGSTVKQTEPAKQEDKPAQTSTQKSLEAVKKDGAEKVKNLKDVKEDSWFYEGTVYALGNGWFAGTTETSFSPNNSMTREMFRIVLGRMGADADDLMDNNRLKENIAREQLATLLYRMAQEKGLVNTDNQDNALVKTDGQNKDLLNTGSQNTQNLSAFEDGDQVSAWAKEAMTWANAQGIIKGNDKNLLQPKAGTSRAEVAVILMRFDTMVKNQ